MTDNQTQATSVGQTGGLPGANADPRAAELPDDQTADTVAMADVAQPQPTPVANDDLQVPGPGPDADEIGVDMEEGR